MSPLLQAQTWVMVNGILTRRGHTPFDPGIWTYGVTPPDVLGQAGLPLGTLLTTAASGDINLTDAGPTGPSNLTFTGSGTLDDPYFVYRFRTSGVIYNKQTTTYTYLKECDLTYNKSTSDSGIIDSNQTSTAYKDDSLVLERCDIHGLRPYAGLDGIFGHSVTTIRCHIYNVVDGFGWLVNTGITNNAAHNKDIGSLVDNLIYIQGCDGNGPANSNPGGLTGPAQQRIDGSHSDAIQIQGGQGHACYGTMLKAAFDATNTGGVTKWIRKNQNYPLLAADNGYPYYGTQYANGVVQINQNEGTAHPVNNVKFDKAWFSGAHQQKINLSASNYDESGGMAFDGFEFTSCIFMNDGGNTPGYYDAGKAGALQSANPTPSYAFVVPSGSNVMTRMTTSGNKTEDGNAVPWRNGSSTIRGYLS